MAHLHLWLLAKVLDRCQDYCEDGRVKRSILNRSKEEQRVERPELSLHPQSKLPLEDDRYVQSDSKLKCLAMPTSSICGFNTQRIMQEGINRCSVLAATDSDGSIDIVMNQTLVSSEMER